MPWGCWVELEDKDVHGKEWKCTIENFAEEEADTTVHQIYGQHATLSVNYKPGFTMLTTAPSARWHLPK